MLSLQNIAYATTFLATSASLNFVTSTIKNALPEIDTKTLEATSPQLAEFVSYASVAGSWAIFGLKIYAAHCTGMSAIGAVSTAIDVTTGAYELLHNPEIINMVAPALSSLAGYMPNAAALVSNIAGVVDYSVSSYNIANMISIGATSLSLEDLVSITNLVNFVPLEGLVSMANMDNLVSMVDITSTAMLGVSASDISSAVSSAASLFSYALDCDFLL